MATRSISTKKTPKPVPETPVPRKVKSSAKKTKSLQLANMSGEQLVVENLSTLSSLVGTLSETLDVLVQKVENIAYHLIATEEVLAEVVTITGLDLTRVNTRIRSKIAQGTDRQGDPTRAIDIAASIASPAPKFRK